MTRLVLLKLFKAAIEFFLVVVPEVGPALVVPDAAPDFFAARVDAPPPLTGIVAS